MPILKWYLVRSEAGHFYDNKELDLGGKKEEE
jgi:hypothetical protein